METFDLKNTEKSILLALGAESSGNFACFSQGKIWFSEDFGDLLDEKNLKKYKEALAYFLKIQKIKPTVILSDLHPNFHTTEIAKELIKKYKAKYIPVQHHLAHIFSAIGDQSLLTNKYSLPTEFIGIACDGTGYGLDGKIWGGELFEFKISNLKFKINRVGHLENQLLLGGEKAIQQPARILISILSKFQEKDDVFQQVKKYYSKNDFELLWNQLQQNFNCLETSSTARVLDAVSALLGFSKNERLSKHGPATLLEQNSTKPYSNLKPKIQTEAFNNQSIAILNTTHLFEYLIKNNPPAGGKDKSRLAATAQKYIADGLIEIKNLTTSRHQMPTVFAGGMANNKILSSTLESQGAYTNKKIPRGDAGISVGQIFYYLLANPRD